MDEFECLLLYLRQLRKWFKHSKPLWRSQFPHCVCIPNVYLWYLRNNVDSYHHLGYSWRVVYRSQFVFHRPETIFEWLHQIQNLLLRLYLNCQRIFVNCTTCHYRIFEVDAGCHFTRIFLFLMLSVTFKIINWPLFVHLKSESSGVPWLLKYDVIFLKMFSSDSKIFHGSPSPRKSHVYIYYLFATSLCVYFWKQRFF